MKLLKLVHLVIETCLSACGFVVYLTDTPFYLGWISPITIDFKHVKQSGGKVVDQNLYGGIIKEREGIYVPGFSVKPTGMINLNLIC